MSKRFRLETGHIVTVDETDAWLLRGRVFKAKLHKSSNTMAVSHNWGLGKRCFLSHMIAAKEDTYAVHFINGDTLDFRRCNLRPMTYAEWSTYFAHNRAAA